MKRTFSQKWKSSGTSNIVKARKSGFAVLQSKPHRMRKPLGENVDVEWEMKQLAKTMNRKAKKR